MLLILLSIPFFILCYFMILTIKVVLFEKRNNFSERIFVLIFTLVLLGSLIKAIQLGHKCYKEYGTIICGGNGPDDSQDGLFPQAK